MRDHFSILELPRHHSPKAGCTYQACGLAMPHECPFVKSYDLSSKVEQDYSATRCQHEWRQRFVDKDGTNRPSGYYCVHCLTIEWPKAS